MPLLARVRRSLFAAALLVGASAAVADSAPTPKIRALSTDRGAYAPGMPVRVSVEVDAGAAGGSVTLQARHLAKTLPTVVRREIAAGGTGRVELQWTPPVADFKGYALEVTLADRAGRVLDRRSSAVDVS